MRIDVWSDLVCPWCAVGAAHLSAALARFEGSVEVVWRSFELNPGAPRSEDSGYDEHLARRYSTSLRGGRAMVGRISAAVEAAGLTGRFDLARPANTFDAHRLLHLARERGRQVVLHDRLTRAFLAEGALLSDPATLERLAGQAGLDVGEAGEVLAGVAYAEDVRADEAEAARREITAVPTFVVDGGRVVPGAQSPEALLATLRRVAAR